MKSLAFGPYIGDFKYEVLYFLPYINWVKEIIKPENIYISSHFNRKFLYKNISNEFYDINPLLTVNEYAQKQHFNRDIFKTGYSAIEKEFKNNFSDDVIHYNFDYNRYRIPCSIFQLKYNKLNFEYLPRYSNKILFIPDKTEKEQYLKDIYYYLYELLGDQLIVLGDKKTHLHNKNCLMSSVNYTSRVYEEIVNAISSCKAVITPASIWTAISNLQGTSVFSWGPLISKYKEGMYSFNNKGKFYPRLDINNLKKCLDNFLEEI